MRVAERSFAGDGGGEELCWRRWRRLRASVVRVDPGSERCAASGRAAASTGQNVATHHEHTGFYVRVIPTTLQSEPMYYVYQYCMLQQLVFSERECELEREHERELDIRCMPPSRFSLFSALFILSKNMRWAPFYAAHRPVCNARAAATSQTFPTHSILPWTLLRSALYSEVL